MFRPPISIVAAVVLASCAFAQDSVDRLFPNVKPEIPDWMTRELSMRDPTADGWPLEAVHDRLAPVLSRFVAQCFDRSKSPDAFAPLFAESFVGTSVLRPKELDVVATKGGFEVRRPKTQPTSETKLLPKESFAQSLDELRGSMPGARGVRTEATIVSIEKRDDGSYSTRALMRVGASMGVARIGLNFEWRVDFAATADKKGFGVRSIELADFEQVLCAKAPFAEYTKQAFGSEPWFDAQFLHGIDDYYFHCDQLTGNHALGLQGIAVGDVNGDGIDDVYVAMQGGLPNRLFVHATSGATVERAAELKVDFLDNTRGALIVDFDNDGLEDLALAIGPNIAICYGKAEGAFDSPIWLVGDGAEDIYSLAAGDADGDGDLDLYACRYVAGGMIGGVPLPYFDANNGATNFYWRNDLEHGARKWTNATDAAGFGANNHRYSLAALWDDFDGDGDLDLFVTNDFGRNNLYVNDGHGHFSDEGVERGVADYAAGMGVTCADVDQDGHPDLYVSNMWSAAGQRLVEETDRFQPGASPQIRDAYRHHARGNSLLLGDGTGHFRDATREAGVARGGWTWGALFVDFENDSLPDIFVPNGFVTGRKTDDIESYFWRRVVGGSPLDATPNDDYRHAWASMQRMSTVDGWSYNGNQRDALYLNLGGARFADVGAASDLDFTDDGRAVATVDWDDDGMLDLLIRNRTAPRLRFLRNQALSSGHWLEVDLQGVTCNRDAIGARVSVELEGGKTLRKTLYAGEGFLAQSSKRLHFGLGAAQKIESLRVRWPNGPEETIAGPNVDQRVRIVQGTKVAMHVASHVTAKFDASKPESLAETHAAIRRVPLVEKIPIAQFVLPTLANPTRKIRDLGADRPTLVHFWSSTGPKNDVDAMLALEKHLAGKTRVVMMSIDEGGALGRARKALAGTPLEADSGYVDGSCATALQVLVLEVYLRVDVAPLPMTFLVDKQGQLIAIYEKEIDVAALDLDLALLDKMDPKSLANPKFFGGRWLNRPHRDFERLSQVFGGLGFTEFATSFRDIAERARQEASKPANK